MPELFGSAALHKAITDRWEAGALDAKFTAYWPAGKTDEFVVLEDAEAGAGQPWPYCVFMITDTAPKTFMTGADHTHKQIRESPLEFHIFARQVGETPAKALAALLALEVMAVFGGHPTQPSANPRSLGGGIILVKYNGDFPVRVGDDEYKWMVRYHIKQDITVATF